MTDKWDMNSLPYHTHLIELKVPSPSYSMRMSLCGLKDSFCCYLDNLFSPYQRQHLTDCSHWKCPLLFWKISQIPSNFLFEIDVASFSNALPLLLLIVLWEPSLDCSYSFNVEYHLVFNNMKVLNIVILDNGIFTWIMLCNKILSPITFI